MLHFLFDSMARIGAGGSPNGSRPARPTPFGVVFWIIALAFLVLVVKRRRALRGDGHASSWADWVTVAGALTLLPLAFAAMRNVAPFLLLAVPAASRLLGPHVACGSRRAACRRDGRPAPSTRSSTSAAHRRRGRRAGAGRLRLSAQAARLAAHRHPRARGDPQLRRPALQPLRRRRLPDLGGAREARVRRQPPGSVSAAPHSGERSPSSAARRRIGRCSSAGVSAACSSPTARRPSRRCAATAGSPATATTSGHGARRHRRRSRSALRP